MMTLPCKGGIVIYPHGKTVLAVEIDHHPHLAARVAAIPGVRLYQDGDHEKTFLFDVEAFDKVAEVVEPKKRRRLSEEQRAAQVERLKAHRFGKGEVPQVNASLASA